MKSLSVLVLLTAGLTSTALAQEAAPASVTMDTWTGAYVGASLGYAQADLDWRNVEVDTYQVPGEGNGAVYALRGGYDRQTGERVIGAFLEYGRTDISETGQHTNFASDSVDYQIEDYLLVALRGGQIRGGALVYGTVGLAMGNLQTTYNNAGPQIEYDSELLSGVMIGLGYERMFGADWSVSSELRFVGFQDKDRDPLGNNVRHEVGFETTSVTIGLNRRF